MDFKLRLTHDVFDDNPELRTVPEFSGVNFTDRMMKYVMLVEWHKTPLRKLRREDRKFKAALWAGYKLEKDAGRPDMNMRNVLNGKVPAVEAALRAFRELQFDEDRDLVEAIEAQIDEIKQFFRKPGKTAIELEKSAKLMSMLPDMIANKNKVMEILNFRDLDSVIISDETVKEQSVEKSVLDEYNESL